ncbi:hypothetical protein CC2G_004752 [Coprinopsis cinerea AmutBmut pab1-1]|nr:hypothetical protein CC2G_004752 [Coprinopsis cinerea AmutBmut pab1-1]
MVQPDLPPEIWLEILAYFHPSFVVNMMGVSRFLFETAMDFKYRKFELISNDRASRRAITQLSHRNIANRVQHLYLRPAFLPSSGEASVPLREVSQSAIPNNRFTWLAFPHFGSRSRNRSSSSAISTAQPAPHRSENLLEVASKSLSQCSNIQRVTIVLYDYAITSSFDAFLDNLWSSSGNSVQRISAQSIPENLTPLLRSITNGSGKLVNLHHLEVTLLNSHSLFDLHSATNSILGLLSKFGPSLSHLSLSSLAAFDFSLLLARLAGVALPKLETFELWLPITNETLHHQRALTRFLQAHNGTLGHFVLRNQPKADIPLRAAGVDQLNRWLHAEFPTIALPKVHTLDIGASTKWLQLTPNRQPISLPKLVPSPLPHLQNLVYHTTYPLPDEEMRHILSATGRVLESLDIWIELFTSSSLDALAQDLTPNLRSLALGYKTSTGAGSLGRGVFCGEISRRRYPNWPLRTLRLGYKGNCGEIHVDKPYCNAVEKTVTRALEIDGRNRCCCFADYFEPISTDTVQWIQL